MASVNLPDPLSRRHLREGALEASKALAFAKAYLEAGRELEAIDFFGAAVGSDVEAAADAPSQEARSALAALQEAAIERGDVFLMRMASAALGAEISPKKWQALADAATRVGRPKDAETAQRHATVGV